MNPRIEQRVAALERGSAPGSRLVLMKVVDPEAPTLECRYAQVGDDQLHRVESESEHDFEARVERRIAVIFNATGRMPVAVISPFKD